MPYNRPVFSFVETRLFSRLVAEFLSDDEYAALQRELMRDPEADAVIRGTGGVRKLRWLRRAAADVAVIGSSTSCVGRMASFGC